MQRISSNTTLFLKIFIPTFWIVFFGVFTLAVLLSNVKQYPAFSLTYVKLTVLALYLSGLAVLYFTLMRLKRVELDESYVYASNYFRTYRYPYHNIERITERDMGLFHLVRIYLKTPGKFGKRLTFLLDESLLQDFLDSHPEVVEHFAQFRVEEEK